MSTNAPGNLYTYAESTYIKINGSSAMTAALNMNTHPINNVTNPTNPQDAATKNYVDTKYTNQICSSGNISSSTVQTLTLSSPLSIVKIVVNVFYPTIGAGNYNTTIGYIQPSLPTTPSQGPPIFIAYGYNNAAVSTTAVPKVQFQFTSFTAGSTSITFNTLFLDGAVGYNLFLYQ